MAFKRLVLRIVLLLAGAWLVFDLMSRLVAEISWFQELGYLPVLLLRLKTKAGLWLIATAITASFCLGNLALAGRLHYPLTESLIQHSSQQKNQWNTSLKQSSPSLQLSLLLPLVFSLTFSISFLIIFYGQTVVSYWSPDLNLPAILPVLPSQLNLSSLGEFIKQLSVNVWQFGILLVFSLFLITAPQLWLNILSIFLSLGFGAIASTHWEKVLQFFNPVSFESRDPVFNHDLSFYIFSFPILQLITFLLSGLFLYGLLSCLLLYLLSGKSLSQGVFPGFSQCQKRHLSALAGLFMFTISGRYWLARYELLYSKQSVTYGASYTDITINLPGDTVLSLLALIIGLYLLWQTRKLTLKSNTLKLTFFGFILGILSLTLIFPKVVQRLTVQPNELAREKPYIERSIAFTRQAFGLNKIDIETFDPIGKLTNADLQRNQLTISNIRLWDKRPLLQTNRQLQQIRPYYKFPDADIDRYTLRKPEGQNNPSESGKSAESQQVILAARELDYTAVPEQAQTWINKHLIYSHGYGFTLSPVNTVAAGGLPDYFVKDIGTDSTPNDNSSLEITSERIRASIPIGNPRIYYGEITDTDVMVPSKVKEFDYPSGNENVYNTYHGKGGISIGSIWRRWIFAKYLNNWQMVLTRNFMPESKVLFRRNIKARVRAIAPFLRYDKDPYLVVANAGLSNTPSPATPGNTPNANVDASESENYLYWMIDAYTTSDRYPYSDPGQHSFNYIRNSIKVVVDAYNGSVDFYIADPTDPIIKSWAKIFPDLFKPLSEMPPTLRSHIRYPVDLFGIQSERLLTYHMEDPQVFYNREDLWRVPNEIYGSEEQLVEPYYLITKLPTETAEEFILLLPFTPASRNNLTAWLAARSDGNDYGKLLLYQFPKQRLVYGPEQIEALINQDPAISEQISLWNRQGSRAIQGNLLVIPIEQSLLYVEPLYLEASQNSLPTLVRVIIAYENRIVMAETLEAALRAIFQPSPRREPAIVRPVEGAAPALP